MDPLIPTPNIQGTRTTPHSVAGPRLKFGVVNKSKKSYLKKVLRKKK